MWRWSNYLDKLCLPKYSVVRINIDETSVKLVLNEGKGHVSERAYRLHIAGHPMCRNASLSAQRSCATHMAAICDNPAFQRLLPQVVLLSDQLVSEARYETIRRSAPANVTVWRLPKAWMNCILMKRYLRLLGSCLRDYHPTHRFILYLDAHKVHIHPETLRVASQVDLWICVIPRMMTWALQPCDTHLFLSYKRQLGEELQRLSGATEHGTISWELVMQALWQVMATLLTDKDWSNACAAVGLSDRQQNVSTRSTRKLQLAERNIEVSTGLPSLEDFEHIFPRRGDPPIHELFLPIERLLRGLSLPPVQLALRSPRRDAPPPMSNPWFGCTRSTSAQALPAPQAFVAPCPRSLAVGPDIGPPIFRS